MFCLTTWPYCPKGLDTNGGESHATCPPLYSQQATCTDTGVKQFEFDSEKTGCKAVIPPANQIYRILNIKHPCCYELWITL